MLTSRNAHAKNAKSLSRKRTRDVHTSARNKFDNDLQLHKRREVSLLMKAAISVISDKSG